MSSVGSNPTPSARYIAAMGKGFEPSRAPNQQRGSAATDGGGSPARRPGGTRQESSPGGESYSLRQVVHIFADIAGEVAESAEGNRLLSGCTGKTVPRVRIPPSPPGFLGKEIRGFEPEPPLTSRKKRATLRSPLGGDQPGRAMAISPGPSVRIPPSPPGLLG